MSLVTVVSVTLSEAVVSEEASNVLSETEAESKDEKIEVFVVFLALEQATALNKVENIRTREKVLIVRT